MTNEELADIIIVRLNEIAMHDKQAMQSLIAARVPCNEQLAEHPSVQVAAVKEALPPRYSVGFLGMLNGIVGAIDEEGPLKGYGYIAAVYDDEGTFLRFRRTNTTAPLSE